LGRFKEGSNDQVERKIRYVAEAFSLDHRIQGIFSVPHFQGFHSVDQFGKGEMVNVINVSCAERDGSDSTWEWLP